MSTANVKGEGPAFAEVTLGWCVHNKFGAERRGETLHSGDGLAWKPCGRKLRTNRLAVHRLRRLLRPKDAVR